MLEVENIIQREQDRKSSRGGRNSEHLSGNKKLASLEENKEAEQIYAWKIELNGGYGGFILMAKRTREDDDENDRNVKGRKDSNQVGATGESGSSSEGFVQRGKSKGKGKGERRCFMCGEEGHLKAQCPHRWYVLKTVFGSW